MEQKFELYGKDGCDYCVKAEELLKIRELNYVKYKLGVDATKDDIQARVGDARKINVVPQIFRNGDYLGGYIDLLEYLAKNKDV